MKDQLTVSVSFLEDLTEQINTLKVQIRDEQMQSKFWEDNHAKLEEKLRIQYDAEFEAFKKSYTDRNEQYKLLSDQRISEYIQQLDERDGSIKNLIRVNEKLNEEIRSLNEIAKLQSVLKTRLEKAERDINDLRHDDGKNSSHIHSGGKGGWSV
jgi:DNA repair exonuclease SbcCD ATPase subunit